MSQISRKEFMLKMQGKYPHPVLLYRGFGAVCFVMRQPEGDAPLAFGATSELMAHLKIDNDTFWKGLASTVEIPALPENPFYYDVAKYSSLKIVLVKGYFLVCHYYFNKKKKKHVATPMYILCDEPMRILICQENAKKPEA